YAQAKKPADKLALTEALLEQARQTQDDPTAMFVLFAEASTAAAEAGDVTLALLALDEQAETFDVPVLRLKVDALLAAQKNARSTDQNLSLARAAAGLAEESAAVDDFEQAKSLAQVAANAARKARDNELAKQYAATLKEISDLDKAFAVVA